MDPSKPHLVVDIDALGNVQIEAMNCTGDQCVVASQPIEIVLGGVSPADRTPKPEMNAPASTQRSIQNQF